MADSFKDILITPNRGNTADPKIEFRGGNSASNVAITATMYPDSNGTLSFEGSVGQLFSITNDLSGSLWSVNDISGIPSIEVLASGVVKIAEYGGNVAIGTASPKTKLHVYTNASGISEALRLQGKYLSGNDGALLRFTNYHASGSVPNAQEYNIAGILAIDDTNSWGGSLNFQTAPTGTSGGSNLATRMTISSSGNVGIGYSTPEYKLDVNGEARFFGATGGGYGGQFRVYNTSAGATNPFKHFRVNSTGGWEIINSAYDAIKFLFTDDGTFTAYGDIRSPIFYDVSNTAYYLDPASTSTSMVVAGNVGLGAVPNTWGNGFKAFQLNGTSIYANGQNNLNIATNVGGGVDGGGNGGLYISSDPAARYQQVLGTHYWLTAPSGTAGNTITFTSKMVLASTGLTVNTDVLAPIYYDKDNTAYYINPNGTSLVNVLNVNNSLDVYGVHYLRSNLAILNTAGTGWNTLIDNGGDSWIVYGGDSVRAPIFYDSNNTAYYVNPNGTSNLLGLTVTNTISGSINGNAGTVTNGVYTTDNVVTARPTIIYSDSADFNTFTTAGTYKVLGSTWSGSSNAPTNGYTYGQLVVTTNGSIVTQNYYTHATTGHFVRSKYNTSDWTVWQEVVLSSNFNEFAPTLTGTGASGNWAINAAYSRNLRQGFNSNWNTDFSDAPAGSTILRGDTNSGSATGGPGGSWWFQQNMRHDNASNLWGVQVAWGWEDNANTLKTRNVTSGTWGSWVTYLNSANYNNYSPTLTGTGASGTWSINVTGSAGSVPFNNLTSKTSGTGTYTTSGDFRAPIFYDNDNTAYYLDAANSGTALILNGLIQGRSSAATDVNTANDTGSISIRGSSTTVASVSFYRTGAYAMNMGLGTDNVFRIGGWSASNNCFQMTGTGDLTMLGNITAYSDERLKTDIVKIENAVEKVQAINGYSYTRTDTGSKHIGVIAQEVMKVIPEVVMGSEDTHYSVAYGNMVGLLIEAIKEQQDHINRLETKINSLQGK